MLKRFDYEPLIIGNRNLSGAKTKGHEPKSPWR